MGFGLRVKFTISLRSGSREGGRVGIGNLRASLRLKLGLLGGSGGLSMQVNNHTVTPITYNPCSNPSYPNY